jgi:hypothetical protein
MTGIIYSGTGLSFCEKLDVCHWFNARFRELANYGEVFRRSIRHTKDRLVKILNPS